MCYLILVIFENGDKSIPSKYKTIMISDTLLKLDGIILEKKFNLLLESHNNKPKYQVYIRNIIQL